jgi:hypothetical protein
MLLKAPSSNSVSDHRPVSEPTKQIVRCCELRKRRVGPSSLVPDLRRMQIKGGN